MIRQKHAAFFLSLMVAFSTFACSHMLNQASPRKALEARVEQLWQARMVKDNAAVYEMTDTKYRQHLSREDFLTKPGMNVLKYETTDISVDGKKAVVKTLFESQHMGILMRFNMSEIWILEDGQWNLHMSEMTNKGPFGTWKD